MKVWKIVKAQGSSRELSEALNAIEQKMHGTVFAILPWSENIESIIPYPRPHWDIVYVIDALEASDARSSR
jgi:hypothetical protein